MYNVYGIVYSVYVLYNHYIGAYIPKIIVSAGSVLIVRDPGAEYAQKHVLKTLVLEIFMYIWQ